MSASRSKSYPENVSVDEQRRAFVLDCIGDGNIDGRVLAANCQTICEWIETGKVPVIAKLASVK